VAQKYLEEAQLLASRASLMGPIEEDASADALRRRIEPSGTRLALLPLELRVELFRFVDQRYKLPDGRLVCLGEELVRCPEVLFEPYFTGMSSRGIHFSVDTCISMCEVQLRSQLYENVLLAGGSTMFPGLAERLTAEIGSLAPKSTKVRVLAPPERKYSAWIGGSMLGSHQRNFLQLSISKDEFDEHGPGIVHRKDHQ
jgi:actin, other eukaryote